MPPLQHTTLYSRPERGGIPAPSPLGQITLIAGITGGLGVVPARPFRVYGSYALVVITRGRGVYEDANGVSAAIGAGDAIFVHPALPHTYGPVPGETWDELYVIFSGPAFDAWTALGVLDPRRPLYTLPPPGDWPARLRGLAAPAGSEAVQVCRLLTLLTELTETAAPGGASVPAPASAWLPRACTLLGGSLDTPHTPEELVHPLGMPYETFRRRFTRELGIPPAQFRAGRVIETACHLLQYTSLTGAQIAERLCFSDEYHFSRRFKQLRGETPTEFRRRLGR